MATKKTAAPRTETPAAATDKPVRTRTRMTSPVSVQVTGVDSLEFSGIGPSSAYMALFEQFNNLKPRDPRANVMAIVPPEGVPATRYRDNLTAAFRKLLKGPVRGKASFRLTTDGRVAIIRMS